MGVQTKPGETTLRESSRPVVFAVAIHRGTVLVAVLAILSTSGCWRPYYGHTYAPPAYSQPPAQAPIEQAAPVYQQPAPVYQQPAPDYPAPVYQQHQCQPVVCPPLCPPCY
jgi:hypothetical protein